MMLSFWAMAWSMAQSTRSANLPSMVYGVSAMAWADHLTGSRTVLNPADLIARKYSALSVTPHAPSRGASRALPRLMPRPRAPLAAGITGSSADELAHATITRRSAAHGVLFMLPSPRVDSSSQHLHLLIFPLKVLDGFIGVHVEDGAAVGV